MARWIPPDKVNPKETIGRRIFSREELDGAAGQPELSRLKLVHFEETRNSGISLDRLGASNINNKVIKYLVPRAELSTTKMRKAPPFRGWTHVKAEHLMKNQKFGDLEITPSPIKGEGLEDNDYHADLVQPEGSNHYTLALHLRHIFDDNGNFHNHPVEKKGFWKRLKELALIHKLADAYRRNTAILKKRFKDMN